MLTGWLLLGYFCPFLIFFNSNGPKHAMHFPENKNISSNLLFKSVGYYIHGERRGKVGYFTEHRHTNTLLYKKYKCNWMEQPVQAENLSSLSEHKMEQEENGKEWWPVCRSTRNQVCSSKEILSLFACLFIMSTCRSTYPKCSSHLGDISTITHK